MLNSQFYRNESLSFVNIFIIYLHKFIFISLKAIADSIESLESLKCTQNCPGSKGYDIMWYLSSLFIICFHQFIFISLKAITDSKESLENLKFTQNFPRNKGCDINLVI